MCIRDSTHTHTHTHTHTTQFPGVVLSVSVRVQLSVLAYIKMLKTESGEDFFNLVHSKYWNFPSVSLHTHTHTHSVSKITVFTCKYLGTAYFLWPLMKIWELSDIERVWKSWDHNTTTTYQYVHATLNFTLPSVQHVTGTCMRTYARSHSPFDSVEEDNQKFLAKESLQAAV